MNDIPPPKQLPRTLRVIIRDDAPTVFLQDVPTFRSVAIELTDEQLAQVELLCTGMNCGQPIYESVSRVFFDEPLTRRG